MMPGDQQVYFDFCICIHIFVYMYHYDILFMITLIPCLQMQGCGGGPLACLVGHDMSHMGVARYAPIPQRPRVVRPLTGVQGGPERPVQ